MLHEVLFRSRASRILPVMRRKQFDMEGGHCQIINGCGFVRIRTFPETKLRT